jgi:hypothetical protein
MRASQISLPRTVFRSCFPINVWYSKSVRRSRALIFEKLEDPPSQSLWRGKPGLVAIMRLLRLFRGRKRQNSPEDPIPVQVNLSKYK